MPMKAAARRPADGEVDISEVRRYVASDVRPENPGANKTQMLRISTGKVRKRRIW
jgi:hypothetical protein